MSELILSWLNDEVQLSMKVTNIEENFSNGYLFGELLSKYNQQLNFSEFINKDIRNAKIKNFYLLQPTFKTLNVNFDSNIVDQVIKGEKNVSKKLLYQLKMALEKVNNPADVLIFSKTGKYNTVTPLKKIRPPKEQFDKLEGTFFEKRIQEMNQPQKITNLEQHVKKFETFKQQQDHEIAKQNQKDEQDQINLKDEIRKIQLNKLQRNMAFMEDWNEKGDKNWKKNMEIKKRREENDEKFKKTMEDTKKNKFQQMQDLTRQDVLNGIDQFENNLKNIGLDRNEDQDEFSPTKKDTQKYVSATATMTRIKEKKIMGDWMRKERDIRRRKMIVDQSKIQREIEVKKREQLILQKLQQQSKQEKEIEYEIWRAFQCYQIITENRTLRDEKYKQKNEINVINAKYKEEEMLKVIKKEFETDMKEKLYRQKQIQIEKKQESRQIRYEDCKQMINKIIDLTDICFNHQQRRDSDKIDPNFWQENLRLFEQNLELIPNSELRQYDIVKAVKNYENEYDQSKDILSINELKNFINGKGQWVAQHQEQRDENNQILTPNSPLNNTLLGDLIVEILEKFHTEDLVKIQKKLQTNPDLLAIKAVIIGYQFSGKKTVSECLNKKYGVSILQVDQIINDLLKKQQSQQQSDNDDLQLASEIQDLLINAKEIPDELYVRVIMNQINKQYRRKSDEEFLAEYNKQIIQKQNLSKKYNNHDIPLTKEDLFKENLKNTQFRYTEGWVLIDFPNTYNQAKLLEKELSGFRPQDEIELTDLEKKLESASLIVKPSEITQIPRKILNGGTDFCFYLNISKQESLRRTIGRRFDKVLNAQFHLDDNPPPLDGAPLVERLQVIRDFETAELAIVDKNCQVDLNNGDMKEWFQMFGFTKETKKMVTQKKKIPSQDPENPDAVEYVDVQVEKIDEIPISSWQEIDGVSKIDDLFYQIDKNIQLLLEYKESKYLKIQQKLDQIQIDQQQKEDDDKLQKENENKLLLSEPHEINQELDLVIQKFEMNKDALKNMYNLWNNIEQKFIKDAKQQFKRMRDQRELLSTRLYETQRRFLELLQRPDNKFFHVRQFQEAYNKFASEQQDMCESDNTKEELHQRVEDLHDALFDCIESKKEDAIEEKSQIMKAGFIESEMERFYLHIASLVYAELTRSFGCQQLITDYYSNKAQIEQPEVPEFFKCDPQLDTVTPIEDENNQQLFPRIEKLYETVLRLHSGEEEIDDKKKQGGKASKKEDKKQAKKGGKEEEVVKELSPLEQEMRHALLLEKQIFRFRLNVLKDTAISRLKEMRLNAQALYNKLQDWIVYAVRVENEAVNDLIAMLRDSIENEHKIQKEIQLNYVDVVISHSTLNFLTPMPLILPAREHFVDDCFSISQLFLIIEEIRGISRLNLIENTLLLQVFARKIQNKLSRVELPKSWNNLQLTDFQQMINNLDPLNTGYVNCKDLCTYICVLNSPILNEDEEKNVREQLSATAGKEEFIWTNFNFDKYQNVVLEENSNLFNRVKYIKELLFYVYKNVHELVEVEEFLKTLNLKDYVKEETKSNLLSYQSFLFKKN